MAKLKEFFRKIFGTKLYASIFAFSFSFFSFFSFFLIGPMSKSATLERTANYFTEVATKHTKNKDCVAFAVEPKADSKSQINAHSSEYNYLKGIFKETSLSYAGAINSDKSHTIKFADDASDINYSVLNVGGSGYGVREYYVDENGNQVYKQEFYPLELMVYSNHTSVDGIYSFIYISQDKADEILDQLHVEHTLENYEEYVLRSIVTISIDGFEAKYFIDNIFYERGYFCKGLHEVMGDFMVIGNPVSKTKPKAQALFFMSEDTYKNFYYIQYSLKNYPSDNFDYKVLTYNLESGFELNNKKINLSPNASLNGFSIFLATTLVLNLVAVGAFTIFSKYDFTLKNSLILLGSCFTPYTLMWLIYLATKSIFLFSNFAIQFEIWSLLGFIVLYVVSLIIKSRRQRKKES